MAKETEFEHPPSGIMGLAIYNSSDNKWYLVRGTDGGALKVTSPDWPLPTGAATDAKQTTMITALQSLQNLVGALHDVGVDEIDVNVISTAGASGYALDGSIDEVAARIGEPGEAAAGTLIKRVEETLTALQSIQNLVGALHDVGLDELDVNIVGSATLTVQAPTGDKIFAFESVVANTVTDADLDTGVNVLDSGSVPSGKVWVITNMQLLYTGTAPSVMVISIFHDGVEHQLTRIPGVASPSALLWQGHVYLDGSDVIRSSVGGATATDDLALSYAGYQMDAP